MPGALTLVVVMMSAGGAGAGVGSGLEAAVLDCRTRFDDAERLACYDAAIDGRLGSRLPDATGAAEVPAETAAVPESPKGEPGEAVEAEFGFEDRVENVPSQLVGRVTRTDRNAKGGLVVTLANGQVWQQTGGERLFMDPGDTVYLFRGAMSAFYLSTSPNGRRYRISRVR